MYVEAGGVKACWVGALMVHKPKDYEEVVGKERDGRKGAIGESATRGGSVAEGPGSMDVKKANIYMKNKYSPFL